MPHAVIARAALRPTRSRGRRARRSAASRLGQRAFLAMRVAPWAVQIIVGTVLLVIVWATVNWIVQVARKPTEVFVAVSGSLAKAPAQTWRQYGPLFDEHSTAVITPELLAALAQVESSGNPVARTYWRWRFSWNPFELYQPASSAVGMFQNHRWNLRGGPALLHPRSRRRRGRSLARPALVLVQRALHTCGARSCCGDDRRAAGSRGRADPRPQPHDDRLGAAAAKPRGDHPLVRRRRR